MADRSTPLFSLSRLRERAGVRDSSLSPNLSPNTHPPIQQPQTEQEQPDDKYRNRCQRTKNRYITHAENTVTESVHHIEDRIEA